MQPTRSRSERAIAIAFGRTPMTLAHTAYDLALHSRGSVRARARLADQAAHRAALLDAVVASRPAHARVRARAPGDLVGVAGPASKLDFRGDFYTHTLMTPFFSPEPHEYGPPPVFLAGVGAHMTEVAGEVCDGFIVHPFTTPPLRRGGHAAGAAPRPCHRRGRLGLGRVHGGGTVVRVVGRNETELADAIKGTKQQIAFYASTPAYRGVLELHGRGAPTRADPPDQAGPMGGAG